MLLALEDSATYTCAIVYTHLWDYLCPPFIILPDIRPHERVINLELDSQPLLIHENRLDGVRLGEVTIEICCKDVSGTMTTMWRVLVYTVRKSPTTSIRIRGASELSSNLPIWRHQVVHGVLDLRSRICLLREMGSTDESARSYKLRIKHLTVGNLQSLGVT